VTAEPVGLAPFYQIDDGRLFNQLPVWAPDADIRKKILVDNPTRLYGFWGLFRFALKGSSLSRLRALSRLPTKIPKNNPMQSSRQVPAR
jgi:hypothetical protein